MFSFNNSRKLWLERTKAVSLAPRDSPPSRSAVRPNMKTNQRTRTAISRLSHSNYDAVDGERIARRALQVCDGFVQIRLRPQFVASRRGQFSLALQHQKNRRLPYVKL